MNRGAAWQLGAVQVAPEDLLLLYTDGLSEARRNGDFFGEERLRTLVQRQYAPVERLPGAILDEVLSFCQGTLNDDVAIVALSLKPVEDSLLG